MKYLILFGLLSFNAIAAQSELSDMIPFPFYDVQKVTEGKTNKLMIIDSGVAAFEKRVEMIRAAKEHIEVEYFIYALDESSKLLTQELVAAAKRGVKVRILIDKSAAVFEFNKYYAKALHEQNIEVRYYNSAALYRISSIQFRNHRKLLSVDDRLAMTGGRNIENDYFDMSPEFNFTDTDVYLEGPMAKTMRLSFDKYFEDKISERPKLPKRPRREKAIANYQKKMDKARAFLVRTAEDEVLLDKVTSVGKKVLAQNKLRVCPETTYSTDRPGGNFWTRLVKRYSDDYRFLRKTLFDKINRADKSVILASPYMINNRYSRELMHDLIDRNVDIQLYTNSLASTDAVYVAANLYLDVKSWANKGIKIHIHDGKYLDETPVIDESIKGAKWGTHTKAHIYESQNFSEIMVGTYNIDNRSNHYNSEMAIFCKGSDELTADLKESIERRMNHGYEITAEGKAINKDGKEVDVMGADTDNKLLMKLITFPSWLLKFLL